MIRVLAVLNSLAPGGTEQSTVALANALRSHEVDVVIVTLRNAAHELTDVARSAGIEVIDFDGGGRLAEIRRLRRVIEARHPHIVHTALFDADVAGRLAAIGTNVPVISSFVSTPYDRARLRDPNVRRWKLELVRLADALTGRLLVRRFHAVSDGVRDANARALRVPLDRIVVAERGREVKAVVDECGVAAHVRVELGVAPDQALVLTLGRQEHQKAHADLVRAVPHLTALGVDAVVVIAGREGNASAVLYDTIANMPDAAERIRVLGHRTDVDRLLAAADVLAIPSHFEGTAGVAIEAMAAGTPIVSTDLDGLRGVLDDGRNAVLVPIADPFALAAGIARVVDDRDLADRLAATGHEDYERRFTIEASAARMAALYRDVLAEARPRRRRAMRERQRRS